MSEIIVYKLTTQDNKTRKGESNECVWGPGITHKGTGKGSLCGPGYIHAYLSPFLAVLLNPIHANIPNPRLWECSVDAIAKTDNDLKVGAVSLTTVREIEIPKATQETRTIFAILCAEKAQEITAPLFAGDKPWQITYRKHMAVYSDWARDYLQGKNRTADAADAAYAAACAAADAAYAAAYAADAAPSAYAAAYAACAAADAAYAGLNPAKIDFVQIAADSFTLYN